MRYDQKVLKLLHRDKVETVQFVPFRVVFFWFYTLILEILPQTDWSRGIIIHFCYRRFSVWILDRTLAVLTEAFFWFFSVHPAKCQDNRLIRPWLFPSKSFPIHHHLSSYHPTLYNINTDSVIKKIEWARDPTICCCMFGTVLFLSFSCYLSLLCYSFLLGRGVFESHIAIYIFCSTFRIVFPFWVYCPFCGFSDSCLRDPIL
jgi:hypothetical protein